MYYLDRAILGGMDDISLVVKVVLGGVRAQAHLRRRGNEKTAVRCTFSLEHAVSCLRGVILVAAHVVVLVSLGLAPAEPDHAEGVHSVVVSFDQDLTVVPVLCPHGFAAVAGIQVEPGLLSVKSCVVIVRFRCQPGIRHLIFHPAAGFGAVLPVEGVVSLVVLLPVRHHDAALVELILIAVDLGPKAAALAPALLVSVVPGLVFGGDVCQLHLHGGRSGNGGGRCDREPLAPLLGAVLAVVLPAVSFLPEGLPKVDAFI